jgi:hypothetical protein
MGIEVYGIINKVQAHDHRVTQQQGDSDGIIASYYDLSGNPSVFMSGISSSLGYVGIKTNTPNEALTVNGNISATGFVYQQQNFCVASLSANQSMTSSDAVIQFVDKNDPNSWWNSTTHKFAPTVAGYYNIIAMVNWIGTNAEVQINNQIRKNNNTIAISQMPIPKSQTHSVVIQSITYMNGTTDTIDVTGYTGTNTSITGETGGNWTKFEAFKIC